MKYLKNLAHKIYIFLFRIQEAEKPKKRRKRQSHENVSFGQFTTIKSVLDSLDSLFADMRLLRPKHKEFQKLVRQYGPYICSLDTSGGAGYGVLAAPNDAIKTRLDAGYKAYGLPTFLINYRDKRWAHEADDRPVSEFFIARKQKSFPYLKPKHSDTCYECCGIGMLSNEPIEVVFNIVIDGNGNVSAYPYLANIPRLIRGRVVSRRMGLYYPDFENLKETCNIDHRKQHLVELFCANYNMVMSRESGINIIVKKGKDRATITVPPNRWKYFFKTRDKVLTPSGRRKPIFHAVSSHHRQYQNGKVVPIKTHYRGARSFRWGEYSIKIILPGKHAKAQASFGLAGEIVDQNKLDSGKWVDMGSSEMSGKINKVFEGEV